MLTYHENAVSFLTYEKNVQTKSCGHRLSARLSLKQDDCCDCR